MKRIVKRFTIVTHHETELINITDTVLEEAKASGVTGNKGCPTSSRTSPTTFAPSCPRKAGSGSTPGS